MTHRQEQILPFSFGTTIKENQNTRGRTMGLQNIFDMVKADRYTQDGREEIIKAQKETEDARRTYKNGEISEKTGLMKTSNGWVKPKSGEQTGAASKHDTDPQTYIVKKNDELRKMYLNEKDPAKKAAMKKALQKQASMMESESFAPGAKTGPGKSPNGTEPTREQKQEEIGKFYTKFKDKQSAYDAGRQTYPEGGYTIFETPQGFKVVDDPKIIRRMNEAGYKKEVEVPEGTKPPKYPSESNGASAKTESKPAANKGAGAGKGAEADNKAAREAVHEMNMKSKEAAANRANERRQKEHDPDYKPEGKKALKLPDEKSSFQTDVNRMKKLKQQDYKQYTIQLEKLHSKYPINKWTALYDKTTRDSAPLTGDCKIRVRKS